MKYKTLQRPDHSAETAATINRLKDRIKRLEEDLMDAKNKHAALVADVALYEDRGERIKRLEEENDAMRADLLLWREDKWRE